MVLVSQTHRLLAGFATMVLNEHRTVSSGFIRTRRRRLNTVSRTAPCVFEKAFFHYSDRICGV